MLELGDLVSQCTVGNTIYTVPNYHRYWPHGPNIEEQQRRIDDALESILTSVRSVNEPHNLVFERRSRNGGGTN